MPDDVDKPDPESDPDAPPVDDPDPQKIVEKSKESLSKIRQMTDELRAVMEHEQRVAGDILRDVGDKSDT